MNQKRQYLESGIHAYNDVHDLGKEDILKDTTANSEPDFVQISILFADEDASGIVDGVDIEMNSSLTSEIIERFVLIYLYHTSYLKIIIFMHFLYLF